MEIKFLDPIEHVKKNTPPRFMQWFLNRPNRTAYLAEATFGDIKLTQLEFSPHLHSHVLVTRDWIIPVFPDSYTKKRISFLESESPEHEKFNIYVAISPNLRITVGFLSKKSAKVQ